MPSDSASGNSSLMGLLSTSLPAVAGGSMLQTKTPGALLTGMLESRTLQESLVKQFDLVHHYKVSLVEDACHQLALNTVIREDVKSGITTINVKADNPALAAALTQAYVTELDRMVTNDSTSAARRERIFLEARLKEIKKDLDGSANALSAFSTKNRTIDIPTQGKALVESEFRLQEQMTSARSELAALQQRYSADNENVRAMRARIAEIQREADKMRGAAQGPGLNVNDSVYPSAGELPALGVTYSDLQRRVHEEEALWGALTSQYEEAKVQEAKEIPSVRVLDAANMPQRKSGPSRKVILMVGTMLSLLAAFILVRAATFWEGLRVQDERRKLVMEIAGAVQPVLQWLGRLPGLRLIYARSSGTGEHP
jgi:capsule polysaccharide export protein KpsE/RkpR